MQKTLLTSAKIFLFTLPLVLSLFLSGFAYAQLDCNIDYDPSCNPLTDPNCSPSPRPSQMLCPFIRIINVMLFFGGVVFAVIIGWGAIKLATAWGDPKGLDSAKKTWTYALIGLFVVVGAVSIMTIISNTFGLGININSIDNYLATWWDNFVERFLFVVNP
ncbi:pilin [Patescibacteria group bacterium]